MNKAIILKGEGRLKGSRAQAKLCRSYEAVIMKKVTNAQQAISQENLLLLKSVFVFKRLKLRRNVGLRTQSCNAHAL